MNPCFLVTPNFDHTIDMSQRKLTLIKTGKFFLIFYCPILVSLWPQFLADRRGGVVFCCCSPSASRFNVLWIQRCSFAYLSLQLPFYQLQQVRPFSSDFWHQLAFSENLEMVMHENPSRTTVSKIAHPAPTYMQCR